MMLISFVIPAYNAGKTLQRAVESVTRWGRSDVEVLIVEDGAQDDTTEVGEALEESHPGVVRLLHSEPGVSNARNYGIAHATGRWICFLDADDAMTAEAGEVLVADAQHQNCDLILYGHESGGEIASVYDGGRRAYRTAEDCEQARVRMLENPTRYMQCWAKLIRRRTLVESGVRFNPQLRLSEDSDFILRYTRFCQRILFSRHCVYHYSLSAGSAMRTWDGTKAREYQEAMEITAQSLEGESPAIIRAFDRYILMHLNVLMVRDVFAAGAPGSFREKLARMRQIADEDVFSDAMARTPLSQCRGARMATIAALRSGADAAAGAAFALRAAQNAKKEKESLE